MKRDSRNIDRSKSEPPLSTRSATISPITLANLKPCPEHGETIVTCGTPGQRVDHEVLVPRVGEHAAGQRQGRPVRVREVAPDPLPQQLLVARREAVPVEVVRVDRLAEVVVAADLEARDAEDGEAVEEALRRLQDEDGKAPTANSAGTFGCVQMSTWRSGTKWRAYCGANLPTQAPAVTTSFLAR